LKSDSLSFRGNEASKSQLLHRIVRRFVWPLTAGGKMRPERTDQREFIVRRDAGVDEEVGDDSCMAVQKIIFLQIPICYNASLSFVSDRKGLFQCPQSPSRTTTSPSSPGHSIATSP
jgi:hypothetical protein